MIPCLKNTCGLRLVVAAAYLSLSGACCADDLVIGDFKGSSYGDWKTTGTAFQKGPASSDLLTKLEIENAAGAGVASSEIEGDAPMGTLTSPDFKISKKYISFRIGGGNYEHHICLNLLIKGKVVKSATGWRSDRLVPASWDVSQFSNQTAQVQIMDEAERLVHWAMRPTAAFYLRP